MGSNEIHRPRTSAEITAYFSRLAGTYGDGVYYGNRRQAVLDALAPELAQARDVLDVGCGNGAYLTKFVALLGDRTVTGVDLSFDMLMSARQRAGSICRLLRANVKQLPFKQASFDFVFASHVLQFIADADVDGVVAEFARRLRPGGVLIVTGRRGNSARQMMSALIGPERWPEFRQVIFRRTMLREAEDLKDRFQQAFVKAGLRVEERPAPFTVDWAAIEEWLRIRWTPLIPADERDRADAMIAELGKTGGSQSMTMNELLILGRRDS